MTTSMPTCTPVAIHELDRSARDSSFPYVSRTARVHPGPSANGASGSSVLAMSQRGRTRGRRGRSRVAAASTAFSRVVLMTGVLALCSSSFLHADSSVTVIRGATVLTVTKGTVEQGTVIVRDGKIAAVGTDLPVPEGAKVIEGRKHFLIPGIVDVHSHLGVYPWPGTDANSDGNELTDPNTAMVRAVDSIWFEDPGMLRAVAGGTTTIQVLPGSGNVIGGESAILKLKVGAGQDGMVVKDAPRGLKMAMGENPKGVYGPRNQLPSTRMGNVFVMREAYMKAAEYSRKWTDYQAKKDAGDKEAKPPDRDLRLETLADVLKGKIRVHTHCYRADEILQLFDIADEAGFKIAALHHALEAYKVVDAIKAHGAGVATFADWWGYKFEAFDAIPQNAAILLKKGVLAALKSDSADLIQRLNQEAAKEMRYGGLTRDEALTLVTINPAKILGLESRIGSIEVGKDADLVLFDRDPMSIYARVDMTMIDGSVVFDRERDYDRFVAHPSYFAFPGLETAPALSGGGQ